MSKQCSKCHEVKQESEFYQYNYVTSNMCKACKKAYIKEWASKPERKAKIHAYKTSEEYKEYNRHYREEHKEELKGKVYNIDKERRKAYLEKYNKAYREKNKERLKDIRRAPENLARRATAKREKYAEDPEFREKIRLSHKTEHVKMQQKGYQLKAHKLRRQWVAELKAGKACIKCGISDPMVLDFHHRDPSTKLFEIAQCVSRKMSREAILAEAAKCDIYCACCHARVSHEERMLKKASSGCKDSAYLTNYKNERRQYMRNLKAERGCCICGEKDPIVLDFHHKDEQPKENCLGNAVYWSWDRIKAEMALCDVYCKNHHRLYHKGNRWPENTVRSLDTPASPAILPLTNKEAQDGRREAFFTVGPEPQPAG